MPPGIPKSSTAIGTFPQVPWVSPNGFSGSDKSSQIWTEYRCLWTTVEGYDGSAKKPRPIPRPSSDAIKKLASRSHMSVMLLPSSLGERYSFAIVVNSAEGGIRVAAPTEEAQIAWIGHIEEAIMSAKVTLPAAQQRRRSSAASGLLESEAGLRDCEHSSK